MKTSNLSTREREVLSMISEEMTNGEIAKSLYISTHTVISHRRRLLMKFNARNSVGLVRRAIEYGIIRVERTEEFAQIY